MGFAPQRHTFFEHINALFEHINSKSAPELICFEHVHFDMCFAPSALDVRCFFLASKCASCHNCTWFWCLILPGSAPAAFASLLFDPSEPQIITSFRDFPTFSRACRFFRLTLSLLWSSLFCSYPTHLCFAICPDCRGLTSRRLWVCMIRDMTFFLLESILGTGQPRFCYVMMMMVILIPASPVQFICPLWLFHHSPKDQARKLTGRSACATSCSLFGRVFSRSGSTWKVFVTISVWPQ